MFKQIPDIKYHFYIHFVVLIWGFTGILGKLITVPSEVITLHRLLIASFTLFVVWKFVRKTPLAQAKQVLNYLAIGALVGLHWLFFFEALHVSTVSITLICLSSATLFSALIEPLFFKRRIIAYELFFGLLIIAGLAIIYQVETTYVLGITYALISAFFASLFTVLNGKMIKNGHAVQISMFEMIGGVITLCMVYFFKGNSLETLWQIPLMDLLWIVVLGTICTAFAFVLSVNVMKHLSPFTVTMSINMEPIYAIVFALMIFGEAEQMNSGFYIGSAVIMLSIVLNAWLKSKELKKPLPSIS